jgi:hypothetical protein
MDLRLLAIRKKSRKESRKEKQRAHSQEQMVRVRESTPGHSHWVAEGPL